MINSSPILSEDRGIPSDAMGDVGGASGSGAANFEFGVDPTLDPELAMVRLLVSHQICNFIHTFL